MTFTDAAVEVLRKVGRPLHYKEITDLAIDKNLLSHVGKSPEVTMGARLAALMKKESPDCPLVRVKPGVFALAEWDEKTLRGEGKKGGRRRSASAPDADAPVAGEGAEAGAEADDADPEPHTDPAPNADGDDDDLLVAADDDDDDEVLIVGRAAESSVAAAPAPRPAPPPRAPRYSRDEPATAPDEKMRAELVAAAADMFDEEDDDDQPILGSDEPKSGDGAEQEGRRRRRRRRRGRGGANDATLPSYTATPVEPGREGQADRGPSAQSDRGQSDRGQSDRGQSDRGQSDRGQSDRGQSDRGPREHHRDRGPREEYAREPRPPAVDHLAEGAPPIDDLGGRDLADAVAQLLGTFDRNMGPVSLRQVAEAAQRRGKLAGEPQLAQSLVAACVRADNSRRLANGSRPRFRFAGGRIALTDWLLSNELASLEAEAISAVERYRDAARRAFARKIVELPGHAFVELCALVLERVGVSQLRAIRRPGVPGYEAHFSALLKTPAEDVRAAIVIRRDGREVGRERVTELRGSLHHYGPATVGWIFTSGQILSGARDEAAAPGVAPVSLSDGAGVARLCEDNDVAVLRTRMPIAIPDVDLLEALRAS